MINFPCATRRAFLCASASGIAIGQKRHPDPILIQTVGKHLDMLLEGGKVVALKGKDAESATAMAYYRMAKITGEAKYTKAALHLAELTIKRMRSSAIGLLDIKEWGPNKIMYGAPPPLGWYGAYTSAILGSHDRMDDVRFIGGAWIGTHGMRVAGGLPRPA